MLNFRRVDGRVGRQGVSTIILDGWVSPTSNRSFKARYNIGQWICRGRGWPQSCDPHTGHSLSVPHFTRLSGLPFLLCVSFKAVLSLVPKKKKKEEDKNTGPGPRPIVFITAGVCACIRPVAPLHKPVDTIEVIAVKVCSARLAVLQGAPKART